VAGLGRYIPRKLDLVMTVRKKLIQHIPPNRMTSALVHSGFIVAGAVTIILGPILPILIARWSLSDERAGLFFTLQFCGNLLGIVSIGPLISQRGYGQTLGIGFSFIALGIAGLNLGSQLACLIATAAFGYGLGLVLSATNLWVAETAPSRRASALTILNLAWGIGAIICPVLVMLAQQSNRLGILLFGIAGLSLIHALVLVARHIDPRSQGSATGQTFQDDRSAGMKTAVALGALFFLYCGTESAIGGWAGSLAKRIGTTSANFWELAPMLFWAGLLGGRALGPFVLHRASERTVLILGLTFAGTCDGALLLLAKHPSAAICLVGVGLGFACVFPLLVSSLVGFYGKRARGVGSIVFCLASLGGATIPWLVGFTSTHVDSLRAGLMVPLIACMFMLCLLSLLPERATTARVL
jgi:MFS transporter, FHS family, glucose/mannose:H+ symporter